MVNVSPIIDKIVNFAKPFLKEKIRNRVRKRCIVEQLYVLVFSGESGYQSMDTTKIGIKRKFLAYKQGGCLHEDLNTFKKFVKR